VVIIAVAIVVGCIVFFKVQHIEVSGNSRYTQEEVVAATGIQVEDNLFRLNKFKIAEGLRANLPYIEAVNIRRRMPDTILINVIETAPVAAVNSGGVWWLMNENGKLLERVDSPGTYTQVTGLVLLSPSEGTVIAVDQEQRLQKESLLELIAALVERELISGAQYIDLTDTSQLAMGYDNRLEVRIALADDFDYRVRQLEGVLAQIEEGEGGILDMTIEDRPHLYSQK
jgi:cell division protein FtsQ